MTEPMILMREEFDAIDKEIVKLLEKRFELSEKIGVYKNAMKIDIEDANREQQVLKNIERYTAKNYRQYSMMVYGAIIDESKKVQLKMVETIK